MVREFLIFAIQHSPVSRSYFFFRKYLVVQVDEAPVRPGRHLLVVATILGLVRCAAWFVVRWRLAGLAMILMRYACSFTDGWGKGQNFQRTRDG